MASGNSWNQKLITATKINDVHAIQDCINHGADVHFRDESAADKMTALHWACLKGHFASAKTLILNKTDLDIPDKVGNTPLHYACRDGYENIVRLLIQNGAKRDSQNPVKNTPLCIACKRGHGDIIKILLEAGANINNVNERGNTPLHLAGRGGHYDCIKILIQAGADFDIKNNDSKKPLDLVNRVNHEDLFVCLNECILTKALKESVIEITIIKVLLVGAPAVGKTSFLHFLLNWDPPKQYTSTGIVGSPVRAIERVSRAAGYQNGKVWYNVDRQHLNAMISEAMPNLIKSKQHSNKTSCNSESEIASLLSECNVLVTSEGIESSANSVLCLKSDLEPDISIIPKDFMDSIDTQNTSDELYTATWIHALDSGGQPQFVDVCRAFVRYNCVNIIVMKLTESLDDTPSFHYAIDGTVLSEPCSLQMTNIEIIVSLVRSLSCGKYSTCEGKEISPLFCIVGTCLDKTNDVKAKLGVRKIESLCQKNARLLEALNEFRECLIFYDNCNEELIFPVNNLLKKDREKVSASIRQSLTRRDMGIPVQIPMRWYIFEMRVLQEATKQSHGLVSLTFCLQVGAKMCMNEAAVKSCLEHLNSFNLIIYFGKVLNHVIFTNPQYLIDMVSKLISVSFVRNERIARRLYQGLHANQYRSLRQDGLFDDTLLDQINLPFHENLFTKEHFLQLLQNLLLISPVQHQSLCQSRKSTQYFMPLVLPFVSVSDDVKCNHMMTCQPIIILFKKEIVPQSVFPATVVSLLNRQSPPQFVLDTSTTFNNQLRHAVRLYSKDLAGVLLLIDAVKWIEVYFAGNPCSCHIVRDVIKYAITACAQPLSYNEAALDYDIALLCRHDQCKSSDGMSEHPAIVDLPQDGRALCCVNKEFTFDLELIRELSWFEKTHSEDNARTILPPEFHVLINELTPAADKWKQLGDQLQVPRSHLNSIQNQDNIENLSKVLEYWMNNDIAYNWQAVITALQAPSVGHKTLARQLFLTYCI